MAAIAGNKVGDTVNLVIDRNVGKQDSSSKERKTVKINLRLSK